LPSNCSAVDRHPPIVETPAAGRDEAGHAATSPRRWRATARCATPCIALHGELGAGKTTLVRHLLRALGVHRPHQEPDLRGGGALRDVPGNGNIWHFDFYRFDDPREWEDAGFRDIFASPGLKLAEWPDKAIRSSTRRPISTSGCTPDAQHEGARQVRLRANTVAVRWCGTPWDTQTTQIQRWPTAAAPPTPARAP